MRQNWPIIIQDIVLLARRINRKASVECTKHNITLAEHYILLEMYRLGCECGQEDIIEATCFHKSTVSRGLRNLSKKGFLSVYDDPNDSYKRRACLLDKGIEYGTLTIKKAKYGLDLLSKDFMESDKQKFVSYLKSFHDQIRNKESYDHFDKDWPMQVHYIMNIVKYMEFQSDLYQNEGREANQIHILACLLSDKECTFKQIEKILCVAQSVIVRQMKKLEEKEWVETFIHADDKRIKCARLTEKGKREANALYKVFMDAQNKGCQNLSNQDIKEFQNLLHLLLQNAEKDIEQHH